jgi:HK97 family phage portal protein
MAQIIYTDGANAKSINPWDLDANPEAWTWLSNAPQNELDNMFYKVAASFRAVNKRAIAAANVPFQVLRGEEVVDDSTNWTNAVKFLPKPKDLIKRVSLSLTFKNAAYLLQGKDVLHQVKGLHFLVPTTINPVVKADTGEVDYYERSINGRIERIAADDKKLVKIWLLDHTTELLPSKNTAAQAAFNAAGSIFATDLFVRNFFERGGVKPTVLALKGAVFNEKKEDVERGWDRFLKGIARFTSGGSKQTKLMNAETMQVETIGAGVDDLKNNEIYRQAIENIALAFGMPTSHLLSDWDSYATATVDYMMWQRDDIFPLCEAIAEDLNLQVFTPQGLRFVFQTEMSDAETQDEVDRAKAYQIYVDAGIKPSVAAQMVGIELPDGVEYKELDAMAEEKQAQEEAKQQADRDQQLAMQEAKKPKDEPKPVEDEKPKKPAPAKAAWIPTLDEYKELDVWREVALRRFKKGDGLDFEYQPHYGGLPDALTFSIRTALLSAGSADEIKAAFEIRLDNVTETPAPVYAPSELVMLAKSINAMMEVELKKLELVKQAPAPAPNIYMSPITLTAQMPAQEQPSVTFAPVIQPSEVINQNTINVEPTPVTVENEVTVQPAKVVLPKDKKKDVKLTINRNSQTGAITGAKGEIE